MVEVQGKKEERKMSFDEKEKKRLAIVDPEKCKPSKCAQECRKACPVVRMGKECVQVSKTSKQATILASCIGCSACVKACPFGAIRIVNLPQQLSDVEIVHRFGLNGFQLFRLPLPRKGQVLGIVGVNGSGKSSALKILGNKLAPNFGHLVEDQKEKIGIDPIDLISTHFRGSSLQNYFNTFKEDDQKA